MVARLSRQSRAQVVVFGRQPCPGRAKTRLAVGVGPRAAARVYGALLHHVLAGATDTSHEVVLSLAEPTEVGWRPPIDVPVLLQAEGDLGARMRAEFDRAFASGFESVALIGSDIPACDHTHLQEALTLLDRVPVVLGPAGDGGYYLVAQRAPGVDIFSEIVWSSAQTLSATRVRLRSLRVQHAEIATLDDVDTVEDLRQATLDPRVSQALRAQLRDALRGDGGGA